MKKKELLKIIKELENRLLILEAKDAVRGIPYYPQTQPVFDGAWWGIYPPYGPQIPTITCGSSDGYADTSTDGTHGYITLT